MFTTNSRGKKRTVELNSSNYEERFKSRKITRPGYLFSIHSCPMDTRLFKVDCFDNQRMDKRSSRYVFYVKRKHPRCHSQTLLSKDNYYGRVIPVLYLYSSYSVTLATVS